MVSPFSDQNWTNFFYMGEESFKFLVANSSIVGKCNLKIDVIFTGVRISQRWVCVIMTFFSLFCMYTIRVCISTAITEMALPTTESKVSSDDTCPSDESSHKSNSSTTDYGIGKYQWNEELQVRSQKLYFLETTKTSWLLEKFLLLKMNFS